MWGNVYLLNDACGKMYNCGGMYVCEERWKDVCFREGCVEGMFANNVYP